MVDGELWDEIVAVVAAVAMAEEQHGAAGTENSLLSLLPALDCCMILVLALESDVMVRCAVMVSCCLMCSLYPLPSASTQ